MPLIATRRQTGQPKRQSILPLASAPPADEITFWKWQEHAVYSRIFFGTVQELRLDARESYVIDDEQSTGHEARDRFLVDLGVELRGLKIGEAKRDLLEPGGVVESVAMNGLDRTSRSGAGDVLSTFLSSRSTVVSVTPRARAASDSHRLE